MQLRRAVGDEGDLAGIALAGDAPLPHRGLTVEIEHLGKNEVGQRVVHALIWLERDSQKSIVIGKQGQVLKQAGSAARLELAEMLGERVHLELWVKVREHWADNERELQRLGFDVS